MSELISGFHSNTKNIKNQVIKKRDFNIGFNKINFDLFYKEELKMMKNRDDKTMRVISINIHESLEENMLNFLKRSNEYIDGDEFIIKKAIDRLDLVNKKKLDSVLLKGIYLEIIKLKSEMTFDDMERNRGILHDNQDDDVYMINVTEGQDSDDENKGSEKNKHYVHFIAGGLAGCLSRTLTAPLERLKILYQVNYAGKGIKPPSILQGLKEVYLRDGFKGLYRGNLMSLMKSTPDTAIKLYVFEKCKSYFKNGHGEKLSSGHLFIAGAIAGVTANFTIFPLDVIKTRLSAAPSGTYKGIIDTALKLYKEGGLSIFYKGVEASLCCTFPNSGLNLCFYELLKRAFSGSYSNNNANSLSTPILMLIGGLSSMFSSTLLYPFQTIQSRIIMQGLPKIANRKSLKYNSPYNYIGDNLIIEKRQNMPQIIKSTYLNEGFRGFFKGYGPGITKIILGNAFGFGLYENIKIIIEKF